MGTSSGASFFTGLPFTEVNSLVLKITVFRTTVEMSVKIAAATA
jgi:hypothetical protein